MALAGAWHAKSNADCEVLSVLADRPYPEIEDSVARLLQFDDCPVWSAGQHRGVASKIDALFAISRWVTERDLTEFFLLAEYVLSESDPKLEFPEERRWAAGLYGKVRNHSAALREGICETLVILSVHGNNLFRRRLGIDVEAQVSLLIRRLMTPLTLDKLLSQDSDLPRYAEAAPDEFLKLLEGDLNQPQPVVLGLLRPGNNSIFGGCPRSGILWALECLAWNPQNLSRVSALLAQLSRTTIDDNWMNKPITSLQAIYRSWMPQTAATLEDRQKALEALARHFPDIAWQISITQFEPHSQIGHYSYRPRWRSDASGAGQPVTIAEIHGFARKSLDLAIGWPQHNGDTLGDLVERLGGMTEEDQSAVWGLIDAWSANETDENAKARLRERIRRHAFTRRGRRASIPRAAGDRARLAYAKLEPCDPVIRHAWLFADQWVQESADEFMDEDYDFSQRAERIHGLRTEAMKAIWALHGFEGVTALLSGSDAPQTIGRYAASCVSRVRDSADFLRRCLAINGDLERKIDACMQGFLPALDAKVFANVLSSAAKGADLVRKVRLFRCAPFCQETWRLLDQNTEEIRARYWREVDPHWNRHSPSELIELVDRLLEADRPRAAFQAGRMDWKEIETSRLKRLLGAVATSNAEPAGRYQLSAHDISAALRSLDRRAGVTSEEMAQLEFLFIEALRHNKHGIPNLERQIAEMPVMFVQAVALVYKRRDDGEDPPGWRVDDPERRTAIASAAYGLLDQIKRIPGTGRDGQIDVEALSAWLTEARRLCAHHGRAEMGDQCIGQLLSRAPAEQTGLWPCLPVCEAMERAASPEIAKGFTVGVYNTRGAHWRGEGGAQERELAAKYRRWAQQLAFDYPYIGGVLEGIAASYDREADWQDSEAVVRKRLPD